jgi:linoleate 10R-lipoxygenase
MIILSENVKIMQDLGRYHDYDWSTPAYIPIRVNLTSYQSAKYLLKRSQDFTVMWNDVLGFVMGKGGEKFCLGGDTRLHRKQRELMRRLLYREKWHEHVKPFYRDTTLRLNLAGIFSEQELWMAMSVIFTAIFFDFEPTKSF